MPNPGGSATANGILYQVLGTVGQAVDLSLRGSLREGEIEKAILVVEPAGGGGDLRVLTASQRVIEQWKARSDQSTWSLAELVDDVLPDLFAAVTADDKPTVYRFVTEGRVGSWEAALGFFRRLGPVPDGEPIVDCLDHSHPIQFSRGESMTERDLFLRITDALAPPSPDPSGASIEEHHRKVWRLLARFEIRPSLGMNDLVEQIHDQLRQIVDAIEDIEGKRHELCGRILELAGRGDVYFQPEDLLRAAGLTPRSFLAWNPLRETLRNRLDRAVARAGFEPTLDVRGPRVITSQIWIHVVTGDSGQGKTWTLAAMAARAAAGPSLAAWVPAVRGGRRVDEMAADEIWCVGLGHERSLSMEMLNQRRALANPACPDPWAIVFVDGVHSGDEAAYLTNLDWEAWNMHLVLSAPREIARGVEASAPRRAEIVEVMDFTQPQLREYLRRRNRSWADIAHDMREVLRRPILAKIHADLADEPTSAPRLEYELMERYWQRVRDHPQSGPQDYARLRALAGTLLGENPVYPWPPEILLQLDIDPATLDRLKQVGWLRETERSHVEFVHDRLMCWAVAETIVSRRRFGDLTTASLIDLLLSVEQRNDSWTRRLGYVLLDTIWLLCDQGSEVKNEVHEVLARLELRGPHSYETRTFYEELLPTLGSPVVPAIIERVQHVKEMTHSPHSRLAADALLRIADREQSLVVGHIEDCLRDEHPLLQELGLRLAAELPNIRYLDRLWDLHRPLATAEGDARFENYNRYQISSDAIAACLQQDPGWATSKIAAPGANIELLSEVAYVLARTHGAAATAAWNQSKGTLIELIPGAKRRSIISCILQFRDGGELDRLAEWVECEEEHVGGTALAVLAHFDPIRAVSLLERVPAKQLWGHTGSICDVLMAFQPDAVGKKVRRLAQEHPDLAKLYFSLVGAGDRIDEATCDAIIDRLDRLLEQALDNPSGADQRHSLFAPLEHLDHLHGMVPLDRLRARAGSVFEERLTEFASRRADNGTSWVDHEFKAAKSLLLKIGGEGFTRVLNALLQARSEHSQLLGCELAAIRPDEQTKRLLADLAARKELWGDRPNGFPVVQQKAVDALAAIGAGVELVRAVLQVGMKVSPYVSELRSEHPPLMDEAIAPALALLEAVDEEQRAKAILALGVTGRTDLHARIKREFLASDPASPVALASMLALEDLGGRDRDLHDRLLRQYRSGHYKFAAAKLLGTGDRSKTKQLMVEALPSSPPFDEIDQRVLAYLVSQDDVRPLIEPRLKTLLATPSKSLFLHFEMPQLLDPRNDADHDQLWQMASKPGGSFHFGGTKADAVMRLAETDADAALELAQQSLLRDEHDRHHMPELMLDLDAERAIPLLLDRAIEAYDRKLCRTIAIALRRRLSMTQVTEELHKRLHEKVWHARRVAANIAGYLTNCLSEDLEWLALNDGQLEVCLTATRAVRRQQREREAARLVTAFGEARDVRAWGLASEILHLVDPLILTLNADPLRFLEALQKHPNVLRAYVERALKKRNDKIESDLKSLIGRWKNDR